MARHRLSPVISAIALYLATAMGAGIFALPYVVARTGVLAGIILLLSVAILTHVTIMAYAEVIARTAGTHQFTGYATLYLGKYGRWIGMVSQFIGTYGALTAYLLGISAFCVVLFSMHANGAAQKFIGVAAWSIAAFVIGKGLRTIARFELTIMFGLAIVFFVLVAVGLPSLRVTHWQGGNIANAWQAFGVMLFAFGALNVVPEIRRFLLHRRRISSFGHVLQWGVAMTFAVYVIFTALAIGIVGPTISENAVMSMKTIVGPVVFSIAAIFGIITMGSSFIASGFALQEMYHFDFRFSRLAAWAFTLLPPLLFFLFDIATFLQVLFVTGILVGGIQGILVFQMLRVAHRRNIPHGVVMIPIPLWVSVGMQMVYIFGTIASILLFFFA